MTVHNIAIDEAAIKHQLEDIRDTIIGPDEVILTSSLDIWPGCTFTLMREARTPHIHTGFEINKNDFETLGDDSPFTDVDIVPADTSEGIVPKNSDNREPTQLSNLDPKLESMRDQLVRVLRDTYNLDQSSFTFHCLLNYEDSASFVGQIIIPHNPPERVLEQEQQMHAGTEYFLETPNSN